jgi:hypothetical protein
VGGGGNFGNSTYMLSNTFTLAEVPEKASWTQENKKSIFGLENRT